MEFICKSKFFKKLKLHSLRRMQFQLYEKLTSFRERHRITRYYSVKLQRARQTLKTSKNLIEFTYGDFPCHRKVN